MAKTRIPLPEEVATNTEYQHDRTCCVCRTPGQPTQIHHIDDDPANNSPDNLAVLCLTCHDQTQIRGGFSRKLRAPLVRLHRDEWVASVARRRAAIDELLVKKAVGIEIAERSFSDTDDPVLAAYLETLPELLVAAVRSVQVDRDSGVTTDMVGASMTVAEILERVWVRLARFYGPDHFGDNPGAFLEDHVSEQVRWIAALVEPSGAGTGGTIIRTILSAEAANATARAVEDIAQALLGLAVNYEEQQHWLRRWRGAVDELTG